MSNTQSDESPDEEAVFPFVINSLCDRGQTRFCKNLLVNLFEPGISPCKSEFPDIKIKRQIIERYLKDVCSLTQIYGIYTIEISTPRTLHGKYIIQTDDIDLEFSKVFTEYIKSIQYQNSQRANSIFTNKVLAIICSYLSIRKNRSSKYITSPNIKTYKSKNRNRRIFNIFKRNP